MPIEILIRQLQSINFLISKTFITKNFHFFIYLNSVQSQFLNLFLKIFKYFFFFKNIIDLVGIDWPNKPLRFELIYNLLNINFNIRCFISLNTSENTAYIDTSLSSYLNSGIAVFNGLNWLERENWDMFGIFFFNHDDLRRILTDYGFEGFPLRKDFPLTGFLELRYDEEQKSILYEDVELTQEFRFFDFESPWKKQF